ncbi:hypothetical protein RYX36_022819, partial [Vicia faba]
KLKVIFNPITDEGNTNNKEDSMDHETLKFELHFAKSPYNSPITMIKTLTIRGPGLT